VLDLKVAPSQLSRFPTAAWVSQLYTITEAILELRKFMPFCTFKIQRKPNTANLDPTTVLIGIHMAELLCERKVTCMWVY